jgi:hypothetical protein
MDDAALERLLFPAADGGANTRAAIDWPAIQRELKRRSVTLALLWQEYLAEHPNGSSASPSGRVSAPGSLYRASSKSSSGNRAQPMRFRLTATAFAAFGIRTSALVGREVADTSLSTIDYRRRIALRRSMHLIKSPSRSVWEPFVCTCVA